MKTKELMKYLEKYPEDSEISAMIVEESKRKITEIKELVMLIDVERPMFFLIPGKESDMDEKKEEQIPGKDSILNHPEYMPGTGEKDE